MFLCSDKRLRCGEFSPESTNYYEWIVPIVKYPFGSQVTYLSPVKLSATAHQGYTVNQAIFEPYYHQSWFDCNKSSLLTMPGDLFSTEKRPTVLYVCLKTDLVPDQGLKPEIPTRVIKWIKLM